MPLKRTPNPPTWNSSSASRVCTEKCSPCHYIHEIQGLDQYFLGRLRARTSAVPEIQATVLCFGNYKTERRQKSLEVNMHFLYKFHLKIEFRSHFQFSKQRRHKERNNFFKVSTGCSIYLVRHFELQVTSK